METMQGIAGTTIRYGVQECEARNNKLTVLRFSTRTSQCPYVLEAVVGP